VVVHERRGWNALARQLTPQAQASIATPLPRRQKHAFTPCRFFKLSLCTHGSRVRAAEVLVTRVGAMKCARGGCGVVLVGMVWCCASTLVSPAGAAVTVRRVSDQTVARASSATVFSHTLRKGQSGGDIKILQRWLSRVGYKVPETGFFGDLTKAAVRRFQLAHRLFPASGSVGNRTSSTLRAAVLRATNRQRIVSAGSHSAGSDPIPGFKIQRDDMGVDASARTGAGIYAPASSKLVQVMRDWYAGEPQMLFQFDTRPAGALSDYWYVAEQIVPVTTTIGTRFQRGQRVASFAASGTGIEIGWGSPTSNSRTLADETDPGAADPPAGSTTVWAETFKEVFGIK
jgi:peptidoglycan hydrolase-like protein with peptidoglycan-binding domain